MGIGVHLQVIDSLEWRWLRRICCLVPAAGLLVAAWQCAVGPTWLSPEAQSGAWPLSVLFLLAALAFCLKCFHLTGFAGRSPVIGMGHLRADVNGVFFMLNEHSKTEVPASVSRVLRLPGLIVMQLTPVSATGQRLAHTSLAIGRSSLSAHNWRQLNVWLLWLERGTGSTPPSAASRGAA